MTGKLWRLLTLLATLACAKGDDAEPPPPVALPPAAETTATTTPPVLQNREQIVTERARLSERLVGPGDTLTVNVFVVIDSTGAVSQPEIKQELPDSITEAAYWLVGRMHFAPAQADGRPKTVLLTIPVRFARP